jgi:TatD DNase family protein
MGPLVDAHMHLQEEVYFGHAEGIVARAREAGVGCLVCDGTHPYDWPEVAALAAAHAGIVPCFGLHPWFVAEAPDGWLAELRRWLLAMPSGVGEIGLDRLSEVPAAAQEEAFRAQLALARELGRPASVHCVRGFGRLLELLRGDGLPEAGFLMHGYGGPAEMVAPLARLGARFSFGGSALWPGRKRAVAALLAVPAERLLVETDAPAMPPPPAFRPHVVRGADGRDWHEPANLPAIVAGLAALRGIDAAELAELSAANAEALFGGILCRRHASREPS